MSQEQRQDGVQPKQPMAAQPAPAAEPQRQTAADDEAVVRAPGGMRHLAMIVCILLGVFIYAGWRIKSQQPTDGASTDKPTAGVMGVMRSLYDNLRRGLGASDDAPVVGVPAEDAPVGQEPAVGSVQPIVQVAPAVAGYAGGRAPQTVVTRTPAIGQEPVGGGVGSAQTQPASTGLDGLSLPGDPAGAELHAAGAARVEQSAHAGSSESMVSVSGRSPAQAGADRQPVLPGSVATPGSSEKLRSVYEKVKALDSQPVASVKPGTSQAGMVEDGRIKQVSGATDGRSVSRNSAPTAAATSTSGRLSPGADGLAASGMGQPADLTNAGSLKVLTGKPAERSTIKADVAKPEIAKVDKVEKTEKADKAEKEGKVEKARVRSTDKDDDGEFVYTVQNNDTLAGIAEKYLGGRARAKEIFEANRDQMARPDQMKVGMRLRIPGAVRGESPLVHVVSASDSLPSLAVRYYGSATQERIAEIRKANPALQHGGFKPGMRLVIPAKAAGKERSEAETVAQRPEAKKAAVNSYVVKPGDNLRKIAEVVYSDPDRWRDIYEANRKRLPSANVLYSGVTLTIPQ